MSPAEIVRRVATEHAGWADHVRHDPDERTYALVHRDDDSEVYVVCWMDGHDTGFHDHDDSAAAIMVVQGSIVEERLGIGGALGERYDAGAVVEVPPEAIHRVRHAGEAPAVTLHAYSPPLRRVGTYEITLTGALLRRARDPQTPLVATASS